MCTVRNSFEKVAEVNGALAILASFDEIRHWITLFAMSSVTVPGHWVLASCWLSQKLDPHPVITLTFETEMEACWTYSDLGISLSAYSTTYGLDILSAAVGLIGSSGCSIMTIGTLFSMVLYSGSKSPTIAPIQVKFWTLNNRLVSIGVSVNR